MTRHHSKLPTLFAPLWQSLPGTKPARSFQPHIEPLEDRAMMSVAPLYYSATGAGNNLANPDWGRSGSDLLRIAAAAYGDGISSPAGADLPSRG